MEHHAVFTFRYQFGIIALDSLLPTPSSTCPLTATLELSLFHQVDRVKNEKELLETLVARVRESDPEILSGYDMDVSSWGFVFQRAAKVYENDKRKLCSHSLSRLLARPLSIAAN